MELINLIIFILLFFYIRYQRIKIRKLNKKVDFHVVKTKETKKKQMRGVNVAKSEGIYKGRKKGSIMSDENYLKRHQEAIHLLKGGLSVSKVSKLTGKAYVTVKRVNDKIKI